MVVNNTGSDVRMFDAAIGAAIKNGGVLPEEIADIFTLTPVDVNGKTRWLLNWA